MSSRLGRRQRQVRQLLLARGEVGFSTLAAELGVSEMTIRRDIDVLEADGLARKVLGGAIAVGKFTEPSFDARATRDLERKLQVADLALSELSRAETVILDGGSTALAVARAIAGKGLGLTVVTHSVLVAGVLADEPETTVLMPGGQLRPGERTLIGAEAVEGLSRYNCDTFIMGVAGIDIEHGFTDYHHDETAVKRAAIAASDRLVVVADGSKFGRAHLMNIAPLAGAAVIVTDAPPDDPILQRAGHDGVRCLTTS